VVAAAQPGYPSAHSFSLSSDNVSNYP